MVASPSAFAITACVENIIAGVTMSKICHPEKFAVFSRRFLIKLVWQNALEIRKLEITMKIFA